MAEYIIDKIAYNGDVYKLQDNQSGYITGNDVPSISLNGSSTTSASFYAPTDAGTSGQVLTSNGSGAPTWATIPTGVTVTLNGSTTTTPSFYAPIDVGTDGYVLKSNGGGAPTWTSAVLTDEKLSVAEVTSGNTYYPIVGSGTSAATRQIDSTGFSYSEKNGDESSYVAGYARLTLGNSTNAYSSGGKVGQIVLYGTSSGSFTINPQGGSYQRTIRLPYDSGTLALQSEIAYPSVIWIYGNDDGNGNITYDGPTYYDTMSEITGNSKSIRCYYTTTTPDPEDEYNPISSEDYSIYYLSYYDGNYEDPIVFINTTINNGNLTYSVITIDSNDNITRSTINLQFAEGGSY